MGAQPEYLGNVDYRGGVPKLYESIDGWETVRAIFSGLRCPGGIKSRNISPRSQQSRFANYPGSVYAPTMWFLTAYLTSSALLLAPSTSIIRYL
jgi:hypothetical protein